MGDAQPGMDLLVQLSPQLALLDVDLLHGIVHPQEIIGGVPEGFQENRRRHLSSPVDPDIEDVPRVKLKVEPRSAIRDDPRRKQSEEHTSELQSLAYLVCRLLLEKKKKKKKIINIC